MISQHEINEGKIALDAILAQLKTMGGNVETISGDQMLQALTSLVVTIHIDNNRGQSNTGGSSANNNGGPVTGIEQKIAGLIDFPDKHKDNPVIVAMAANDLWGYPDKLAKALATTEDALRTLAAPLIKEGVITVNETKGYYKIADKYKPKKKTQ